MKSGWIRLRSKNVESCSNPQPGPVLNLFDTGSRYADSMVIIISSLFLSSTAPSGQVVEWVLAGSTRSGPSREAARVSRTTLGRTGAVFNQSILLSYLVLGWSQSIIDFGFHGFRDGINQTLIYFFSVLDRF